MPNPLRPVAPLFKHYKTLLKLVTRDASLRKRYQPDIDAVMRDVERWLAEAKVAADFAPDTYDWDTTIDSNDIEQEDPRERWALERLCDVLVEKAFLSQRYIFSQVRNFLLTRTIGGRTFSQTNLCLLSRHLGYGLHYWPTHMDIILPSHPF